MTFYDQLEDWLNKTNYKAYISDKKASGARKEDYTDEENAVMKAMLYANNAIQRAKLGKSFDMNELLKNVRFIADRSQQDGFHYGGPNATAYGAWLNNTNKKSSADYESMQKILGTKVTPDDIDNYDNLTLGQKVELMDKFGYDYNNSKSRSEFFKLMSNRQRDKAIKEIWEPETNAFGWNKKAGEWQPWNWLQEMSMQYGPAKLMTDYAKENWENITPDRSWQGGGMLGRGVAGVGINTVETLNPAKGISTGSKVLMQPVENKFGQFALGNALAPMAYATAEQLNSDEFDPRQFITDAVIGTAVNAGAPVKAGRTEGTIRQYIPGSEGISKWLELPEEKVRTTVAKATKEADAPIIYKDFEELANAKGKVIPYTIGLHNEPSTWVSKNPKLGEKMVTPEQHQKAVDVYEAFAGPHAKGYPDLLKKDALYAFDPDVVNAFEHMGDKTNYLKAGINDAIAYGTNKAGEEKWATKPFSIIGFDPTNYTREQEEQKQVTKDKKQAEGAGIKIDYVPEGLTYDEQKVVEMIKNNPGLTIGFGKPEDVARVSKFLMLHPEYGRIGTFKVE